MSERPTAGVTADSSGLAIVVPAYKGRHLGRALASLAGQSDRRFRVYVADDGSPEKLEKIVEPFHASLRLEYRRFDDNLGSVSLVGHWRRAIGLTSKPWIWLFADDDEAEPGCVAAFHAARAETGQPEVDLFRFNMDFIDEAGRMVGRPRAHPPFEDAQGHALAIVGDRQRQWRVSDHIFSRAIYEARGGFPDFPLAFFSDSVAWIEFGTPRGVRTITGARVRWRQHAGSLSSAFGRQHRGRLLEAIGRYSRWLSDYGRRPGSAGDAVFARQARRHVLHLIGLLSPVPDRIERKFLRESLRESWPGSAWRDRRDFAWVWLKCALREKPGFRTLARWRFDRSFKPPDKNAGA